MTNQARRIDSERMKKVEQWAEYVRDHPHQWRAQVNPLINSQITKAQKFYQKLAKTPKGRETIQKIKDFRMEKPQHTARK